MQSEAGDTESMKGTWYQYLKAENGIRLLASCFVGNIFLSHYIRESERTVHLPKKK